MARGRFRDFLDELVGDRDGDGDDERPLREVIDSIRDPRRSPDPAPDAPLPVDPVAAAAAEAAAALTGSDDTTDTAAAEAAAALAPGDPSEVPALIDPFEAAPDVAIAADSTASSPDPTTAPAVPDGGTVPAPLPADVDDRAAGERAAANRARAEAVDEAIEAATAADPAVDEPFVQDEPARFVRDALETDLVDARASDLDGDRIRDDIDDDADADGRTDVGEGDVEHDADDDRDRAVDRDDDGDGIVDEFDLDADGDGFADASEDTPFTGPRRAFAEDIPAFAGSDADGDGIRDFEDPKIHVNDQTRRALGLPRIPDEVVDGPDRDRDGFIDDTERLDAPGRPVAARDVRNAGEDDVEVFAGSDLDLDGVRDFEDDDIDDDGVANAQDLDDDNDGLTDEADVDRDGDGIVDDTEQASVADDGSFVFTGGPVLEARDVNLTPSRAAGVDDLAEIRRGADLDGDGIANIADDDLDGDGVVNADDDDRDGDGFLDDVDDDLDGNGFTDDSEVDAALEERRSQNAAAAEAELRVRTEAFVADIAETAGSALAGVVGIFGFGPAAAAGLAAAGDDSGADAFGAGADPVVIRAAEAADGHRAATSDLDRDGLVDVVDPDIDDDGLDNADDPDRDEDGLFDVDDIDSDDDGFVDATEPAAFLEFSATVDD